MPSDPKRVRDLFYAALELAPQERARYLDDACRGDSTLRAEVDELMLAHEKPDKMLEPPSPAARVPAPELGALIAGRYTLVEIIGEGGMGSVYRASQSQPVKRQVALKLIKSGMDSKAVLARFDAERQALALMDHPHIARVYDGGSTATGQPYFVMELVQGVPLTNYCDTHRLAVRARLQLFISVCQAVQHAHQKGIIHRDLKPGNVLVTEVDGRPMPKVIDFGVAKATEQKLTDMSFSDVGAIVGTPADMSPEQADPSAVDIDTRTDVYALGVMLYELLTGSPPIDSQQFKRGAVLEMLRMVREIEPPRPSTRVSTADTLPSIAANRDIEPGRLARLMQGELDWVVMKALEKDRSRRYDTVNGLARDIERYLADEMVEARPPSAGYRLRKFVRRHRGQVLAAALLVVTLLGGAIGTSIGMVNARRSAEDERAAKLDALSARETAEKNAQLAGTQATLALNSIQSLISETTEKLRGPGLYEIRQALLETALKNVDQVSEGYDKSTSKEATTMAALVELGGIYRQLGQSERASRQFTKALAIAEERVVIKKGTDASRRNLALVYSNLGATVEELDRDMGAALDYQKKALALFEDIDEHPMLTDSPMARPMIRANLAEAYKLVGIIYYRLGKLDDALPYYQKAYNLAAELAAAQPSDPELQINWTKSALALGSTAYRRGDPKQAETYLSEARARAETLLAARPDDVNAKLNMGDVLYLLGETHFFARDLVAARSDMQSCLKLYDEIAAAEPRNIYYQRNLSKAHYRIANLDLAENHLDDARTRFETVWKIRNEMIKLSRENDRRQMEWMLAEAQIGEVDQAAAIAARLGAGPRVDAELRMDLARCYAIASRTLPDSPRAESLRVKALESLQMAVKDGYRDRAYLDGEPDFAPLRERSEFKSLLVGLQSERR